MDGSGRACMGGWNGIPVLTGKAAWDIFLFFIFRVSPTWLSVSENMSLSVYMSTFSSADTRHDTRYPLELRDISFQ